MMKVYSALEIARYVIKYSNDKRYGITNIKLQKLLYLIQAYFLIKGKLCFSDRIEAWNFGPVVPTVYREYKRFVGTRIPTMTSYLDFDINNLLDVKRVEYDEFSIKKKDRKLIEEVVDNFAYHTASDLVDLTHGQKPWIEAYFKGNNTEITIESLKRYFCGA